MHSDATVCPLPYGSLSSPIVPSLLIPARSRTKSVAAPNASHRPSSYPTSRPSAVPLALAPRPVGMDALGACCGAAPA
eukprot:13149291-Alexandrium_andersonii.AAC.1